MAIERKDTPQLLKSIKDNIQNSNSYFDRNNQKFYKFMQFSFCAQDVVGNNERGTLAYSPDSPRLTFNIVSAYLSRLLGEFAKQAPGFKVRAGNNTISPIDVQAVESILRHISFDANRRDVPERIYKNQLGGGYGVMRIIADYKNNKSFDMNISLGSESDPTMCGFDPNAMEPDKHDGQYCFCKYTMSETEFKQRHPNEDLSNVNYNSLGDNAIWFYKAGDEKTLLLCEYYKKKYKRVKLLKLSNGQELYKDDYDKMEQSWDSIEAMPEIVRERWVTKEIIWKYILLGDRILEEEETQFPGFPLIFVDGASVYVKSTHGGSSLEQVTRPYAENAYSAQNLMNSCGQSIGYDVVNMRKSTIMADYRSMPPEILAKYKDPSLAQIMFYSGIDDDGNAVAPPTILPRNEISPSVLQVFNGCAQLVQNVLGSYDAQLGIQDKQLSGIAIQEGATQNNAVAKPYINGYLCALNRAAELIVKMIPLYYKTPRTIPTIDANNKHSYQVINSFAPQVLPSGQTINVSPQLSQINPDELSVEVSAGYNFEIQKDKALNTLISLSQALPSVNEMIQMEGGLPVIFENIDIRGQDQLKQMSEQYTQKKQQQQQAAAQQGAQNNPMMMEMQLKQQELAMKQQQMQADMQIKAKQQQIEEMKLELEKQKLQQQAVQQERQNEVQMQRLQTEELVHGAELQMKHEDMKHKHAHKDIEATHKHIKEMGESNNAKVNVE